MPILGYETCVHPEDLLEETENPQLDHADGPCWWAFHTRPRQEKCLARDLLAREIPFYLPLVRRRLLIRGRAVHSLVPLFGGYLFVCGTNEQRVAALATNRVAQVLKVANGAGLRNELAQIYRLIQSGARLTVESRLEANRAVRIRSGPMMGLEGIVSRRKNETRLIVWVRMLQQGVSVEIEDYLLEPLD